MENNSPSKVTRRKPVVNEEEQETHEAQVQERGMVAAKPNEIAGIVELAAPIDAIVKQVDMFQELKGKLLRQEDYQLIQGKKFIKKSGWRKFSMAFNISDEILKEERQEYMTPTAQSEMYFVWEVTVKAIAPNGRYTVATASCASNEKKDRNGNIVPNSEHNVRATAATRAKNRAISDLIGGGEVSAEEVDHGSDFNTTPNYGYANNFGQGQNNGRPQMQNPSVPMTDKQRNMVFSVLQQIGKDKEWIEAKAGKPIEEWSKGLATGIIDQLLKIQEKQKTDGAPQQEAGEALPTINLDEEKGEDDEENPL